MIWPGIFHTYQQSIPIITDFSHANILRFKICFAMFSKNGTKICCNLYLCVSKISSFCQNNIFYNGLSFFRHYYMVFCFEWFKKYCPYTSLCLAISESIFVKMFFFKKQFPVTLLGHVLIFYGFPVLELFFFIFKLYGFPGGYKPCKSFILNLIVIFLSYFLLLTWKWE